MDHLWILLTQRTGSGHSDAIVKFRNCESKVPCTCTYKIQVKIINGEISWYGEHSGVRKCLPKMANFFILVLGIIFFPYCKVDI